jgi:hypothetical protein
VLEAYPALKESFAQHGVELHIVSAASHYQLPELLALISRRLPPREAVPTVVANLAQEDAPAEEEPRG